MKIILLCLAVSVPSALCILFAKDTPEDEDTRFMVSLQKDDKYSKHFCSGVFITLDFVLTASSCVKNIPVQDMWIVAGTKKLSNAEQQLKIDKVFKKDPSGRNNVRNNIALLHLATAIPDSQRDKVRIIKLVPAPDGENKDATKCKTYGWGTIKSGVNEASDVLQVAPTETVHWCTCRDYNKDLDETTICTYQGKSQLCYFDAGDPLISESGPYLLGIATENYACISSNIADIYTRIDSHRDWILKTIEGGSSTERPQSGKSSSTQHKSHAILMGTGVVVILKILRSF